MLHEAGAKLIVSDINDEAVRMAAEGLSGILCARP
jgi:hypothetical protein